MGTTAKAKGADLETSLWTSHVNHFCVTQEDRFSKLFPKVRHHVLRNWFPW